MYRLLDAHDSSDVALQPDAVLDELRQLRVHQRLVLLEGLPCRCEQDRITTSQPELIQPPASQSKSVHKAKCNDPSCLYEGGRFPLKRLHWRVEHSRWLVQP